MKILMVCLGNICRSPLAEGILKQKIHDKGLEGWSVDSAGTGHWHVGELPDRRSISTAEKHGIDLSDQRARQFSPKDFERFDQILVMDDSNLRDVLHMAPGEEHKEKVKLIMNYVFPNENQSVPDPYWNDDGFEQVFQMLDTACERLIEALSR
jgi:protein-tyrosine phosphatase